MILGNQNVICEVLILRKRINIKINISQLKKIITKLILVLLVAASADVQAAHIVGGEMTYTCLGTVGEIRVSMTLYRDSKSGGAQFDAQARFGVYERLANGGWRHVRTVNSINLRDVTAVLNVGSNPCLIIPPDVGVQKGVYSFDITLPPTLTEYMIAYQRCCRNGSINNIVNPGITGSVTSINISSDALATCNSSPRFNDFPPIVICAGENINFDHGATDPNGDQLTYSFCAPKASGGTDGSGPNSGSADACTGVTPSPVMCIPPYDNVAFLQSAGYSVFNPMGGSPQVTINPVTGLITGVPTLTGQFVVGICVQERRGGVLIGESRRDFQFNVTTCDDGVFANVKSDEVIDGQDYIITSCGDNTVDIINESGLEAFIDEYYWEFDIDGQIQTFNTRDVSLTLPDFGTYFGTMQLNNNVNAEGCRDTADIVINFYPPIFAEYEFEYDTCVAGPVQFTDMSASGSGLITEWDWSFGDANFSDDEDPSHVYGQPGTFGSELVVTDINGCSDSISYPIPYFPVPGLIVVEPNIFTGCEPANVVFQNLSSPLDSTYTILWDFGDGQTSNELSPTHLYEEVGNYSVSLDIISPIGCQTDIAFDDWITVLKSPVAGFENDPEELSFFNRTTAITDLSEDAISWFYTFGDGGLAYIAEPTYTFQDTGMYVITQVVTHESGCTDTLRKNIDVEPFLALQMPNAFTPNNDGLNDDFRGKGYLPGLREYNLSIWNRWGEKVYETSDPNSGWNGEYQNEGQQAMAGVYVFVVRYIGPRGEPYEQKGHVTLIR